MEEESRSILWKSIGATAVVVIGLAAGGYYWYQRSAEVSTTAPPEAPVPAPSAPAPAATAEPEYLYPIDETNSDHATALDQSDAKILDAITHLQGWRASALRLLLPKDLVRHIVATVDGLTGEKLSLQVLPTRPVSGLMQVNGSAKSATIAASNARRYEPYVQALTAIDTAQLSSLYRHFYPLFQQAYRELGYPKGYFNDRLVEVIDDMLEAPEPKPPIAVVAPRAMFHYVDPDLEALDCGQKILVRVGTANESAIKAKLREIRQAITTH
ncbi:MAG TPA: DUF3014 domain-containing protein [Burkholderiaceae bacterium]|nr:DUF3014 domain-containing protein [Burkholderiaceae bacterium]